MKNSMQLTILGTSAATPTPNRNLSSAVISFNGKNYLFDCPENVQRQLMNAEVSYMKVDTIFFSHFHADHILGLGGLIATMQMQERSDVLRLVGPKGLGKLLSTTLQLTGIRPSFKIELIEGKLGLVVKEKTFIVKSFSLKHETNCLGYVFEELTAPGKFVREKALALNIPEGPLWRNLQEGKSIRLKGKTVKPEQVLDLKQKKIGKKIVIIADTAMGYATKGIENADVLVHESTFSHAHENLAKERHHSTAVQAATIAKKVKAKQLVLWHISARHDKTPEELENEAKQIFPNTKVAADLEKIELK